MLNFTVGPVMTSETIRNIGGEQTPYFRTPEFSELMLENEQLMKGYPNGKFMPKNSVTRGEALTAMAKGLNNCSIDKCKAQDILSKYRDGASLPEWAQIPIATALDNGALAGLPNSDMIMANKAASRADVASMLQNVRVAGGYDNNPKTANAACPIDKSAQAYLENEEVVKIPTLKLEFLDQVNAKSAHVGQQFAATTLEDVTINGQLYPCGSRVNGKVIEVIRPNGHEKGALKLAFTEIEHGNCKAELPKQILTAQINKVNMPNPVSRLLTMPFSWAGSIVGTTARTTGGMLSNLGNAVESVSGGVGTAVGETFQGQFRAAGRSTQDAIKESIKAPIDLTRTALSGTKGLLQTTGDEVAFVVDPKDDYQRRDFTVNAMYMDKDLKIYDFCGGQQDLKNRILRMVGNPDQRLKEDPLRILRAIRFHLMYNLKIEDSLMEAMRDRFYLLKNLNDAKIESEMSKIDLTKSTREAKEEIFSQFDIANLHGVIK